MEDVKHAEMKHDDMNKPHMMNKDMHGGPHHHKPWQNNWKSPVSLGIFFLTATLALAVLLYTILNIVGALEQAAHPASSDAMTQQEMQQLEQQAPASAAGAPSATTGQ
jgi:cytochrome c-type biogenesis protein CcmH/NrfG